MDSALAANRAQDALAREVEAQLGSNQQLVSRLEIAGKESGYRTLLAAFVALFLSGATAMAWTLLFPSVLTQHARAPSGPSVVILALATGAALVSLAACLRSLTDLRALNYIARENAAAINSAHYALQEYQTRRQHWTEHG